MVRFLSRFEASKWGLVGLGMFFVVVFQIVLLISFEVFGLVPVRLKPNIGLN